MDYQKLYEQAQEEIARLKDEVIEERKKTIEANEKSQLNDMCWTCGKMATHRTFRDALCQYELTCDKCHREEYPEEYE